jgi:pimeloyl-ACP methyl ester carboxylesterase/DNA-binding CsgD family transcriptional regulator
VSRTLIPVTPSVRFCRSPDGLGIAWSANGIGTPVIKTPNWLNHVELDPRSIVWGAWIERFSRRHRLVRYDARGCGLSQSPPDGYVFADNQIDLAAVADAAGLRRFALYGASQGAAIAIEFAARHPERVSHLVLCGAYLQGARRRPATAAQLAEARTLLQLIEVGWGRADSMFRQVFVSQFIPDSDRAHWESFDEIQRLAASPAAAAALLASFYEIDVTAWAAQVRCPTLVLHARDDLRIPFQQGLRVAEAIPGAEFVALEGRNHILLDHQPAWHRFFEAMEDFFERHREAALPDPAGLPGDLTPAERRVLDRLAAGLDNGQIAEQLGLAPKTVRNHINHIFAKLGVPDRAKAIVRARECGLGGVGEGHG